MGAGFIRHESVGPFWLNSLVRCLGDTCKGLWPVFRSVLMFGLLASVTACVTAWHKPEVSLADVRLAGGNLLQPKIKLQLRVKNPNATEIGLERVEFDLLVGDNVFASGQSTTPVTIPKQGEAMVELDARTQLLALLSRLPGLIDSEGLLHYRLKGEAQIRRYGKAPFDHAGVLDANTLKGLGFLRQQEISPKP
ncbi:MAG: hypothetical protein H6R19_2259 [Proteobacteria bacterium]|nr:hypothetical protein [Pseudomonadota bacterium]